MKTIEVEVSYLGRTESILITQTPTYAVSSPLAEHRSTMKNVRSVSYDPQTKVTTYRGATGKEERVGPGIRKFKAGLPARILREYHPDQDPERFIIDWRLHNAALLKDQEVEGAKLSDWTFFDAQVKAIHRSTLWGLRNKLNLPYNVAMKWADKGSKIFKYEILLTRGCNLDEPIDPLDKKNDDEIMQHEAMQSFHQSHTKHY